MTQNDGGKPGGRERSSEPRPGGERSNVDDHYEAPGAGAHAADHLLNHEATPGSGALPSGQHRSGKEVDGGAG